VEAEHLSSALAALLPFNWPLQHQFVLLTQLLSNALASTSMMQEVVGDITAIAIIRIFSGSERSISPSIHSAHAAILTLSSSLASAASPFSSTVIPLFPGATPMQPPFPHALPTVLMESSEETAHLPSI
jgi:hypothetical protein